MAADELLSVKVLRVHASIGAPEEAIIHLRLHLGFLARDVIWISSICDLLVSSSGLVRVLTLRSLRNVLQDVTLYLHSILVAIIGDLDEAIEVVIRGGRIRRPARAASTRPIDMLLASHPAILGRNCQAKRALALGLLVFVRASNVSSHRSLADLLLKKLLVFFILLCVLLEELTQARIELIVAFLAAVSFTLLGCRLWSVEHVASASVVKSDIGSVSALIYCTRAFLHHTLGESVRAWALVRGEAHWCESLVLLGRAHLILLACAKLLSQASQSIRYVYALVLVFVIL